MESFGFNSYQFKDENALNFVKTLSSEYVKENEAVAVGILLDSIHSNYKSFVWSEFERRGIFDNKVATKKILLQRMQDIILEIAEQKARRTAIDTKGKYISGYEQKRLKMLYFVSRIIDINNPHIKPFVESLKDKIYE